VSANEVSAPGKLMIAGEYAVLEGAPAVVAAVDRRVRVRFVSGEKAEPLPEEASRSRAAAERDIGAVPLALSIDATDLFRGRKKLGLGSSAATAAATAAAVHAHHGHDLTAPAVRDAVLKAALAGHRSVSPTGSGADVAASVVGGCIDFRRNGEAIETRPIGWPKGLHARVVWTGVEARTGDLVGRIRALSDRDSSRYRRRMEALGGEADDFIEAMRASRVEDIIRSTRRYARAMEELGRAAGVSIVTDAIREVARLAENAGGTAKPSGAGGGDVVLALFSDSVAADRFVAACRDNDWTPLSLRIGAAGIRTDTETGS
jgi:phosphomevalonate kinase